MKQPRILVTGIVVGLIALSAIAYGLASANDDEPEPRGEYGIDVNVESPGPTPTPRPPGSIIDQPLPATGGGAAMCAPTAVNCSDVPGIAPVTPGSGNGGGSGGAAGSACLVGATTCVDIPGVSTDGNSSSGSPPNRGIAVGEPTPPSAGRRPAPDWTPPSPPLIDPDKPVSSPPQRRPSDPPMAVPTVAPPTGPGVTREPGRDIVPAPIDGLDVVILESFPPQYRVQVQAGLPSGCAKAAGYEVDRSGDVIKIAVYNSMPQAPVACTMIYGMYGLNVPLTGTFESGKTYTVFVNDKVVTFRGQ